MKVLVTGSSGFLGGVFVNFLKNKDIPYVVYNRNNLEKFLFNFDSVVNFGGLTPNSDIKGTPFTREAYYSANVEGTAALIEVIKKNKNLKKFINIGTAAEYGFSSLPINEDYGEKPIGPYGESKLMQSKLVEEFAKKENVKVVNLRLFNVAGLPKRNKLKNEIINNPFIFESLINQFVLNFNGKIIVNNKNDIRDYVDIEDIMEGVFSALETETVSQYEVINICSGIGTKLVDVVDLFGKALGKEYEVQSTSSSDKGASCSIGINNKAKKILNWKPKTTLEESIKKMIWQKIEF